MHACPYGSGHINDSYKVTALKKNYLLQRVNDSVFKDIPGLTGNIIKVTDFLSGRLRDDRMKVLKIIPTHTGNYYFKDDEGNYWRLFDFIEGSKSYDRVENPELAFEGGKAYGWFLKMLDEFPVNRLIETIPDFHNITYRLNNFRNAVKKDGCGRVSDVMKDIAFAEDRAKEMDRIRMPGAEGKIPMRVTHNDTKINNVLFGEDNHAVCIIDLDTVMPGYVHYDFGDAIRTFTNMADEDEKDICHVKMDLTLFEAFSRGFLSETKDILKPAELETLAFSARLMTYIIGMRFLTDYLEGDTYYKTKYPDHNLVRARVQFRLIESMEEQAPAMLKIVEDLK
ncbi:MAG: aminoglycoside phosphotransferase family protein [Bacteroidetes bacterium]|nr:aminoglycoside phosphotransferase family protein [Bacteroidota bacterium]